MRPGGANSLFWAGAGASLGVHLFLLTVFASIMPAEVPGKIGSRILTVDLVHLPRPATESPWIRSSSGRIEAAKNPATTKTPGEEISAETAAPSESGAGMIPETVPGGTPEPPNFSATAPGSFETGSLPQPFLPELPESYLAEIRSRLERAKHYPWIARLKGLEGTSLVRFEISTGGSVEDIAIVRSSTHALLDEAAVKTIQRAAPFPDPPERAGVGKIELNVPVVFELR